MSVRQWLLVIVSSVAAFVLLSGAATAQTVSGTALQESPNYYITGYLHRNSGGTLFDDRFPRPPGGAVPRATDSTIGYGAALTFGGRYVVSGEVDFNYNPQFFGPEDQWDPNNLLTLSATALLGPTLRVGGVQRLRPYGCVGVGLVRSHIKASVDNTPQTNPLVDVGAGLFWFFHRNVGVRGDIRYRWDRGDLAQRGGYISTLNYVRGSLGLTVAF